MKKLFAVVALAGFMAACNNEKKDETKSEDPTTTTPTTTEPTATAEGVPSFDNPEVAAYVKSYEDYIAMLKQAVEGKDMSKMADLSKMGTDLSMKGTAAAQQLTANPADAKKLADYMSARGTEVMELMKKLTGQ